MDNELCQCSKKGCTSTALLGEDSHLALTGGSMGHWYGITRMSLGYNRHYARYMQYLCRIQIGHLIPATTVFCFIIVQYEPIIIQVLGKVNHLHSLWRGCVMANERYKMNNGGVVCYYFNVFLTSFVIKFGTDTNLKQVLIPRWYIQPCF